MLKTVFRTIVPVSVSGEIDGPTHALIELTVAGIRRIRQLSRAVKAIKAVHIEDSDSLNEFFTGEYENHNKVTDKTPLKECGLLINDENTVTAILAKRRLAGDSVQSAETYEELKSLLDAVWDGSMECERLCVDHCSFYYRGLIRHSDESWSTDSVLVNSLPE